MCLEKGHENTCLRDREVELAQGCLVKLNSLGDALVECEPMPRRRIHKVNQIQFYVSAAMLRRISCIWLRAISNVWLCVKGAEGTTGRVCRKAHAQQAGHVKWQLQGVYLVLTGRLFVVTLRYSSASEYCWYIKMTLW